MYFEQLLFFGGSDGCEIVLGIHQLLHSFDIMQLGFSIFWFFGYFLCPGSFAKSFNIMLVKLFVLWTGLLAFAHVSSHYAQNRIERPKTSECHWQSCLEEQSIVVNHFGSFLITARRTRVCMWTVLLTSLQFRSNKGTLGDFPSGMISSSVQLAKDG